MTGKSMETWLSGIGLSQYQDLFEENGVDFDILGEVTADHLKEMGISALGHRLKLVKAISALEAPADRSKASDPLTGMATAERRQLTIMFCDLVGSAALSARLDPEDYRDLMTLYQETVTNIVTQAGGHVAKYLGDGVLIYFGYPIAQEDAAERATRVGFQLVQSVEALVPAVDERLKIRVGTATGIVVVGDLVGDGVKEASAVAGETPNLAARLQSLAKPGQIVIGDKTRVLLGEMFIYEKIEDVHLKGFDTRQGAWRVISEAHSQERFTMAAGREKLSELVGRDSERGCLLAAWNAAKAGSGRVFLISGEAGIGKSRLSHEVVEQASRDKARVLTYQAAPYFNNTAFYPIRRHIEHVLKFAEQPDPEARLNNLERMVAARTDLSGARALMASLLSLPTDRYPPLNLSPALRKTRTIEMLIEQVLLQSKRGPILLYFEDLHWTDPTSLELLGSFIEKLTDHPILLLATYRPNFVHNWSGDHVEKCELSRLTTRDIEKLMENLTDGMGLSREQTAKLLDRSDGVPLFAEELTRFVLDAKSYTDSDDVVPDSLQDSLMARLDKLGATRELAQIAAAIGREFDIDLLAQVMGMDQTSIKASMEQLVDAHLVIPSRKGTNWTFHHALLQEAAYRSMLRRRRQGLHGKIATTLEDHFPERCQSGPEQVANHLVAGGLGAKSVPYWLTAGKAAWANASANEALAHLGQGLEFVGKVKSSAESAKLELQLQSTIGVVHFAATSYASPQAQAAFERSRELLEIADDSDLRMAVLYGIGAFETMRGDVSKGHETFAALAAEVEGSDHPRYEVYSHSMQAWSYFNRGRYADSIHHGDTVLQLYEDGVMEQPGPRLSAAEPKVISECMRSAALWSVGLPDQAAQVGHDIIDFARQLPDPYSLAYTLANGVIRVLGWTGDWDQVKALTEECGSVADEFGYGFLGVWASIWRARAIAQNGHLEEAEKMISGSIAACKNAGVHYHRVTFEANHARILLAMNRVDEAATVLDGLDGVLKTGGELNHEVELGLVKAELATMRGDTARARTLYRAAMASAEQRKALSWQLRSALGLAPLLEDKAAQRKLIAPIFAQFTEGFSSKDLKAAQTYL
tara:strand:+ start:2345 stop:5635 length:3291 start_codon:yes stop_codon:yes gene_type:complete